MAARSRNDALEICHPAVRAWFAAAFDTPARPQTLGWPAIARGDSTLILAPTGSGKTLAAFLWCLDRLMFTPAPPNARRCRVLYVSPLKALAVDVERNLCAPLAGIAQIAVRRGDPHVSPAIAIRTGDTPQTERARFNRAPADIAHHDTRIALPPADLAGARGAAFDRHDHRRSKAARAVSRALIERARSGDNRPRGMLIEDIDGARPSIHPLLPFLMDAGFASGAMGVQGTFTKP